MNAFTFKKLLANTFIRGLGKVLYLELLIRIFSQTAHSNGHQAKWL